MTRKSKALLREEQERGETYEAFALRIRQERGRRCKVGQRLLDVVPWPCGFFGDGLHHIIKRSAAVPGTLMDPANVLVCCDACNRWIEDNGEEARQLGLSRRRGKA